MEGVCRSVYLKSGTINQIEINSDSPGPWVLLHCFWGLAMCWFAQTSTQPDGHLNQWSGQHKVRWISLLCNRMHWPKSDLVICLVNWYFSPQCAEFYNRATESCLWPCSCDSLWEHCGCQEVGPICPMLPSIPGITPECKNPESMGLVFSWVEAECSSAHRITWIPKF